MEKQQKIRWIRLFLKNVKEWWLNTTTGSDNGILKFLNYLHVILYPHGTSFSTTFICTYQASILEYARDFSRKNQYFQNKSILQQISEIDSFTFLSFQSASKRPRAILFLFYIQIYSLCKLFMKIIFQKLWNFLRKSKRGKIEYDFVRITIIFISIFRMMKIFEVRRL